MKKKTLSLSCFFFYYSINQDTTIHAIISPNNLILDLSKLEALADNKINLTQKLKIVSTG